MVSLPVLLPDGRLEQRFDEAKPLYTPGEALNEAQRCLFCVDAPCIKACPTSIDVPQFIHKLTTGNVLGAARTIFDANLLGASCARVCPVEVLCAGACVFQAQGQTPIAIGRLQRFATHSALQTKPLHQLVPSRKAATGKKVALVGAGPASVTAAGLLALQGHRAVIFERRSIPMGLNAWGIAPYKQTAPQALDELEQVLRLGDVELQLGVEVVAEAASSSQVSLARLVDEYDAVFLGVGLGGDVALSVPGARGSGVWGATGFIERLKCDASFRLDGWRRAVVVGGGNTALDAARELKLLGLDEVHLVYRRSQAEMSGYAHELVEARACGVALWENRVVKEVVREGDKVVAVSLQRAAAGQPTTGPQELLACDVVVSAIGQTGTAGHVASRIPSVQLDARGRIVVDTATQRTGHPKVWAAGDAANGGQEVVNAVAEAKVAVRDMLRVLGVGHG